MPKQEKDIFEEFYEKFSSECFVNFGPESDCRYDIKQFFQQKLKEIRDEVVGEELPSNHFNEVDNAYCQGKNEERQEVIEAFNKLGIK